MMPDRAVAVLAEHGYTPLEDYPGNKKVEWQVRCDDCGWVKPRSLQRIIDGYRCRSCMGWLVRAEHVEERIRAAGFVPLVPYPGRTDRPWLCRCTGCDTEAPINTSSVCRGHGCGTCSGRTPDPVEAAATMIAKGFRPRVPFPGSHIGWESDCLTCGKMVEPRLANVRSRDSSGCAYCTGKAVDAADAEAFMRSNGWKPLVPYPGTPRQQWKCRCECCGGVSTPTRKSVQRGHGCRFCNRQGFDYAGPGHVYVMFNTALGAVKIGIFGKRAQRTRTSIMRADGWETFKVLACDSGENARRIEQTVLHHLQEERGLRPYLTNDLMPQNGATETFDAEHVSIGELWELIKAEARRVGDASPDNDRHLTIDVNPVHR